MKQNDVTMSNPGMGTKKEVTACYLEINKRMRANDHPSGNNKRFRQQQISCQSSAAGQSNVLKRKQQFCVCPVCNRSFPSIRLEEHVNQCLDSAGASGASPPPSAQRSGVSSQKSFPQNPPAPQSDEKAMEIGTCSPSSNSTICSRQSSEATEVLSRRDDDILHCQSRYRDLERLNEEFDKEEEETELGIASDGLKGAVSGDGYRCGFFDRNLLEENATLRATTYSRVLWADMSELAGMSGDRGEDLQIDDMRDSTGQLLDRTPPGFKLYQRQVQSQARLTMFHKFSSSATLQQRRTVTVLQPGMVLFRSWLGLETQQKLVMESQGVAHLFHRASTAGGGKYHVYSMCWGPKWDAKAHRYVSNTAEHLLPPWMFDLAQSLASDANGYSPVYPPGSTFAPDVGLVNFYPTKADELGVIGLGGHQDLDDSGVMPVVSVSVGDSMTFFYRRLPPLSRRKSGVLISVDEKEAKSCEDGDNAHNREHQIVLGSGDVLVFGGESRLVYHGTRNVQPGTRPPGLHVVPGRLNFTFRQTAFKPTF